MPDCDGTVPIVSEHLAREVLDQVPTARRTAILSAAVRWLTERHPGLESYEAVHGRTYTPEERVKIGREVPAVQELPCPFRDGAGACALGGMGPHYRKQYEGGRQHSRYYFLPMAVLKYWDREAALLLVRQGQIADAKVAMLITPEKEVIALHR